MVRRQYYVLEKKVGCRFWKMSFLKQSLCKKYCERGNNKAFYKQKVPDSFPGIRLPDVRDVLVAMYSRIKSQIPILGLIFTAVEARRIYRVQRYFLCMLTRLQLVSKDIQRLAVSTAKCVLARNYC